MEKQAKSPIHINTESIAYRMENGSLRTKTAVSATGGASNCEEMTAIAASVAWAIIDGALDTAGAPRDADIYAQCLKSVVRSLTVYAKRKLEEQEASPTTTISSQYLQ